MDALKNLKRKDNKKQKFTLRKRVPQTSIQQTLPDIDLKNPWSIFKIIDRSGFVEAIDDFVKEAKWRYKRKRENVGQNEIDGLNTDFSQEDLEYFGKVLETRTRNTQEQKNDIRLDLELIKEIDKQYILMFFSLKHIVPWYIAVYFLKEYADDNRNISAPRLYDIYIQELIVLRKHTRLYLQKRIPKVSNITNAELKNANISQIFENYFDFDKQETNYVVPPFVKPIKIKVGGKNVITGQSVVQPDKNNQKQQHCYTDINDIDTLWLHEYNIKTFVVFDKTSVFATNIELRDDKKQTWYKVNKLFYKQIIDDKRVFTPYTVGYVMYDNSIIIETQEMFDKLRLNFKNRDLRYSIKYGYKIAKEIVKQNELLNSIYNAVELDQFAEKVIDSFKPCNFVKELARKLSFVLVYYYQLVDGEQSYIENTKIKFYKPESLINLKRDTLLPEVYLLPPTDESKQLREAVTESINIIRKEIERHFYTELNCKKIPEAGRIPTKNQVFNKQEAVTAPGLIQKLKSLLSLNTPNICDSCLKHIHVSSPYNSIYNGKKHTFCNDECFENFKFKNISKQQ